MFQRNEFLDTIALLNAGASLDDEIILGKTIVEIVERWINAESLKTYSIERSNAFLEKMDIQNEVLARCLAAALIDGFSLAMKLRDNE